MKSRRVTQIFTKQTNKSWLFFGEDISIPLANCQRSSMEMLRRRWHAMELPVNILSMGVHGSPRSCPRTPRGVHGIRHLSPWKYALAAKACPSTDDSVTLLVRVASSSLCRCSSSVRSHEHAPVCAPHVPRRCIPAFRTVLHFSSRRTLLERFYWWIGLDICVRAWFAPATHVKHAKCLAKLFAGQCSPFRCQVVRVSW